MTYRQQGQPTIDGACKGAKGGGPSGNHPDSRHRAPTKLEEETSFMYITTAVKSRKAFSRIAFFGLLMVTMMAATLHLGAFSAQAAQASLAWSATTTNADGTPATDLAGYKLHIGNASRSYQQKIDLGKVTNYTVSNLTDGSTYYFALTAYNTAGLESSFSNEVSKNFAPLAVTHLITASAGSGGTITALNNTKVNVATNGTTTITNVTVNDGANQAFSIAPATGYAITDVKVDGTSVGALTSYSFSTVKAGHTISATFAASAAKSYTITATAGTGGTITPSGTATLAAGASKSYSIAPASGYKIAAVTVDGASVGLVASYSFSNLSANHTIQASFAASTASGATSVAINCGGAGFTDAAGLAYLSDRNYSGGNAGTTNVAINGTTDDALYQTERWGASSYNIPMANGNYNLTLKFAENYWSASGRRVFDVVVGGQTLISNLDVYAKVGKNTAYDVVLPVSVTNGTLAIKFVNKVDNAKICAIKVSAGTASTSSFSITASAGTGGSITPSGTRTLTSGASQSYAIAAATGYRIADVKVDGASVGAVASYAFNSVTANHSIQATFAVAAGTVVYAVNSGGTGFTDAAGAAYRADTNYSGGNAGTTNVAINGTTDDVLYQTERWAASSYSISLPNGNYNLTLKFAENYWSASGRRVFDVTVGGQTLLSNLDIYARAGKNTAYDVVLPVSVTNGVLAVRFINKVDNAKICAMKVVTR